MHGSRVIRAQLSQVVYTTKKSFQKQLDSIPATAFDYYYQSKIKELQQSSCNLLSNDFLSASQQNTAFKRHIRKEWELLSNTKRRLYYAFFFHFTKINHKVLNKYELAKVMEIPTPATSEYMLFRNKFKYKFDRIWQEEDMKIKRKSGIILRHNTIGGGHRITISGKVKDINSTSYSGEEELTNLIIRFQKMCRECRHVWNEKVTDEQKCEIRNKWEDQKHQFDLKLDQETEILEYNLKKLMQVKLGPKSLSVERPVTPTVESGAASAIVLPFQFQKKK